LQPGVLAAQKGTCLHIPLSGADMARPIHVLRAKRTLILFTGICHVFRIRSGAYCSFLPSRAKGTQCARARPLLHVERLTAQTLAFLPVPCILFSVYLPRRFLLLLLPDERRLFSYIPAFFFAFLLLSVFLFFVRAFPVVFLLAVVCRSF
jgi:hypothetical protein